MFERLRAPSYPSLKRQVAELSAEVGGLTNELDTAENELAAAKEARDVAEAERNASVEWRNKRIRRFQAAKRDGQGYELARRLVDVLDGMLHPATGNPDRPVYSPEHELAEAKRHLAAAVPPPLDDESDLQVVAALLGQSDATT